MLEKLTEIDNIALDKFKLCTIQTKIRHKRVYVTASFCVCLTEITP